eukprot:gb/GECH01000626.1/.p1 GENE.gb/GECH01000626.1/~~gb/GECH01000626.1/.p1  ORF type:complete len:888 (+),score=143.87 gb/GECH01000626.1/:1-2664(+)
MLLKSLSSYKFSKRPSFHLRLHHHHLQYKHHPYVNHYTSHLRSSSPSHLCHKQYFSLAAPNSSWIISGGFPTGHSPNVNPNQRYASGVNSFSSSSYILESIFSLHQKNNQNTVNNNIQHHPNPSKEVFTFLHNDLPWATVFRKHAVSLMSAPAAIDASQGKTAKTEDAVLSKLLPALVESKDSSVSVMGIYRMLKQRRHRFTIHQYEILLRFSLETLDLEAALFFMRDARRHTSGPLPSRVYAHLIDLYGALHDGTHALQVFKDMENKDGLQPDRVACEALLRSVAQSEPDRTMSTFHMLSEQYNLTASIHVLDALLLAAYHNRDAALAETLLSDLLKSAEPFYAAEEQKDQHGVSECPADSYASNDIMPTIFTVEALLWTAERGNHPRLAHQVTDLLVPTSQESPKHDRPKDQNPQHQSKDDHHQLRGKWYGLAGHTDLVCLAVYVLTSLKQERALALYDGVRSQLTTASQYNTMLRAATVFSKVTAGKRIWKHMMDAQVPVSVGTVSRVLWLLGYAKDESGAIALFESAFQEHSEHSSRNLMLNALMNVFMEVGSVQAMDYMLRYQDYADNDTLRYALRACVNAQEIESAREVFEEATRFDMADQRLVLRLAEAEAKFGNPKQALQLLKGLKQFPSEGKDLSKRIDGLLGVVSKHRPNILIPVFQSLSDYFDTISPVQCTLLLKHCREKKDWNLGEQLLQAIEQGTVKPLTLQLATVAMRMLKEDYQSERLVKMYWLFREAHVIPNEQMGIMAMQACRNSTLLSAGLEISRDLIEEFSRTGSKDIVSDCRFMFNTILLFYTLNGDYKQAFHVFNLMQQSPINIEPDFFTFDALLAVASAANNKDLIHQILGQMKTYNIRPNQRSFSTIRHFQGKAKKTGLFGRIK